MEVANRVLCSSHVQSKPDAALVHHSIVGGLRQWNDVLMTAKVTSLDFGMQAPKSRTRHSPSLRPNLPGTSSTQSQFARDTIILCCLTMLVACTHEDIIFIQNPSHSCASSVLPPFCQPPSLESTSLSKLPPTLSS